MLTIEIAEKIRKERGMKQDEFSIRLGFCASAYPQALRRGRISRWMAKEISQRFKVPLDGERK